MQPAEGKVRGRTSDFCCRETAARRSLARSIPTQGNPAAERMGLRSSGVRMQPSARGRLRAAGRCATAFTGKPSTETSGSGLVVGSGLATNFSFAASKKPQRGSRGIPLGGSFRVFAGE